MERNFKILDTCLLIELPKELDHYSADIIREGADRIFARENIKNIVFDFKNTSFMDSSGIGVIIGRYKNVRFIGGSVGAIHVSDRIKKIFTISGLYKIVTIYEEFPDDIRKIMEEQR